MKYTYQVSAKKYGHLGEVQACCDAEFNTMLRNGLPFDIPSMFIDVHTDCPYSGC